MLAGETVEDLFLLYLPQKPTVNATTAAQHTQAMSMNTNLPNLSTPQMIPVDSAEITISTCFADEADDLLGLKNYFQVQNHFFSLLDSDDVEDMANWFDGRPKSMFLTISTRNQAAIQYAFSQGLIDDESVIESAIRDHLGSQGLDCSRIEHMMDEFITPEVSLRQSEDGQLFVDLGGCSPT